jgi:hypothetical protein
MDEKLRSLKFVFKEKFSLFNFEEETEAMSHQKISKKNFILSRLTRKSFSFCAKNQ